MDCGYHNAIARAMMTHISSEENMLKSRKACLDLMDKCVYDLDQRSDKQWFLECYNPVFQHPKKFEFQANKGGDDVSYKDLFFIFNPLYIPSYKCLM